MPRIRVHLLDVDGAAQIDKKPAAVRARTEEEIRGGLVFLGGDSAVVEHGEIAAVAIPAGRPRG